MEKLKYEKPIIEVVLFDGEDVITTSGNDDRLTGEMEDDLFYYSYYE